ncbi:DUF4293 family protein [Blattabacterium cuenoti]|uniref:DUF4293 family protein n=1 Tax=Blattabacterium cuenoti TaxID=1653831 RepID=UPI001EEA34C1|nr:DUF4293 family protein [Blattabacterium cuenoti]
MSILISSFSLHFYPSLQQKKEIQYPYSFIDKVIFIFLIVCLILSICSFLSFKMRKLQIVLNSINIVFNSATFILILFFSFYHKSFLVFRKTNLFLILFSVCIFYFSNRSIKKDIKLINSINRIR